MSAWSIKKSCNFICLETISTSSTLITVARRQMKYIQNGIWWVQEPLSITETLMESLILHENSLH